MPDPTPPPLEGDQALLFGALALQLEFVALPELLRAVEQARMAPVRPVGAILVDRGLLAESQRWLLEQLVQEYLFHHDHDVERALVAACAARPEPIDLVGPLRRACVATLPSGAATLSGPELPAPRPVTGSAPGLRAVERYRILRPHARGALGEVLVAHDTELNREVALKEIQPAYANHPDSRARFVLEAEITGSLEHPGIVPVYSLGAHHDGRPFYAMRFIRGESLHEAICRFHQSDSPTRDPSERALALRGLLTRFVAVCNAVAYAHSRGVIHRDIKPANIMLGPYGETLVVDWGLAKAFDRPVTVESVELPIQPVASAGTTATLLGQAVGTPAFMPPEQAAGSVDLIGPRSDVYSLGATLYHLLTGVIPFPGDALGVLELVKRHQFPPPRRVKRAVSEPLEAIVLKAMAAKPGDRYDTVHDLARDVECWLADEPVRAFREPLYLLAQRWMRRHRSFVTGFAALLLTALFGLALGLYAVGREQERTAHERNLAVQNLRLARSAVDDCFVVATRQPLLQQERMRAVRRLLLEKSLHFYDNFLIQAPDDETILHEVGQNRFRIAVIAADLGDTRKALESYARARDAFQTLVETYPYREDYRVDLARIDNNLGLLQRSLGQLSQALESLEKARDLRDQLAGAPSATPEYRSELAATYNNIGDLHRDLKKRPEARTNVELARDILVRLAQDYPNDANYSSALAATLHNLGRLLWEAGELDEALTVYEDASKRRDRLAQRWPGTPANRGDLASTLLNLGALLNILGRPERAHECYDRARTLTEALASEQPDVPGYRIDLARACNGLGVVERRAETPELTQRFYRQLTELGLRAWQILSRPGQTEEAQRLHERALDLLDRLIREHPEEMEYRIARAGTLVNLGHALRDGGQPSRAVFWYDRVFQELSGIEKRPSDAEEVQQLRRQAHWGRAEALGRLGKHPHALPDWDRAFESTRPGEPERLMIQLGRAFALGHAGQHVRARAQVEALLQLGAARPDTLYELSCIVALAARGASGDPALGPEERKRLNEQDSALAVRLLERAGKAGFFRDPKNREYLAEDPDLAGLEGREDFTAFLGRVGVVRRGMR